MNEREIRLQSTVEQLWRMIGALESLHEDTLRKDPGMYRILSEGPRDMIIQLCRELAEMVGAKLDDDPFLQRDQPPAAIVESLPGVDVNPPTVAGKE